MRPPFHLFIALTLLSTLSAHAAGTGLSLTCITRGLPAGAQVWLEVQPEYHQTTAPNPASLGVESGTPAPASGDSIWQFEVPASGAAPRATHSFTFPIEIARSDADHVSSIYLKIKFKVDAPGHQGKAAYGEMIEGTFGMPVPAGSLPLTRCIRLSEESDKLMIETAPDCRDSTFASLRRGDRRLLIKRSGQ